MVPTKEARQVAISTAVLSIPAAESIVGLTANMYAIVIKVVNPAITSVRAFVLFSFK